MRKNKQVRDLWILIVILLLTLVFTIQYKNNNQIRQYETNRINALKMQKYVLNELENNEKLLQNVKFQADLLSKKRILTTSDIKVLERITEAEAENQGLYGKALVCSVVLNRWLQNNKTVKDIVFEKGQFQPISNGRYYEVKPTYETKRAINMSLIKDYSIGSTYFIAPKYADRSSLRWFRKNLTPVLSHKEHTFYK